MGYGVRQGVGIHSLTCCCLRMRWIQRVEILEENEAPPPAMEGRVSTLKHPPPAPPSGERAEATMMMMKMESAAIETLHSEERSRGDGVTEVEQETESLGKEAILVRREEHAEAVLRREEVSEQRDGHRSDLSGMRQGGEEAGEEAGGKKEPRLNSLSRWVCNTAGFEVRG